MLENNSLVSSRLSIANQWKPSSSDRPCPMRHVTVDPLVCLRPGSTKTSRISPTAATSSTGPRGLSFSGPNGLQHSSMPESHRHGRKGPGPRLGEQPALRVRKAKEDTLAGILEKSLFNNLEDFIVVEVAHGVLARYLWESPHVHATPPHTFPSATNGWRLGRPSILRIFLSMRALRMVGP